MFKRFLVPAVIGVMFSNVASADFFAEARFVSRPNPIVDERGRVHYIIDFEKPAYDGFSDQISPELERRFQAWKSNRSKNFARAFELQYNIVVDGVISYLGPSVTAYLTVEEMERIRRDPRVILVTENSSTAVKYSAPPWADSSPVSPPAPEWSYPGSVDGFAFGSQAVIHRRLEPEVAGVMRPERAA